MKNENFFMCPYISGWGGIKTVTDQVVKALQKRIHEVYLILVERSIHPEWEAVLPVYHLIENEKEKENFSSSDNLEVANESVE